MYSQDVYGFQFIPLSRFFHPKFIYSKNFNYIIFKGIFIVLKKTVLKLLNYNEYGK